MHPDTGVAPRVEVGEEEAAKAQVLRGVHTCFSLPLRGPISYGYFLKFSKAQETSKNNVENKQKTLQNTGPHNVPLSFLNRHLVIYPSLLHSGLSQEFQQ